MGFKHRNSSRPVNAGGSAPLTPKSPKAKPRGPTDFTAPMGRFSDALSILATATRSLAHTQEDSQPNPDHDIGEDIVTLEHGLSMLRAVYDELDVGIREVRA